MPERDTEQRWSTNGFWTSQEMESEHLETLSVSFMSVDSRDQKRVLAFNLFFLVIHFYGIL